MAVNTALKIILDLPADAQRVGASSQQLLAAMTQLHEAETAHPDEQLSPDNLRALTDLVSTTDVTGRLLCAANTIAALYPQGGHLQLPRARTLQLARCGRLIAALVAVHDPDHPISIDWPQRIPLANALNDLMEAAPDAVALATAPLGGPDRRASGGGGGGEGGVAALYLLGLQACSHLIAGADGTEPGDAFEAAAWYAASAMIGLWAIYEWEPGYLPRAAAAAARRAPGGAEGMARAFAHLLTPRPAPRGGESGRAALVSRLCAGVRTMLCRVLPLLVDDEVMSQALEADGQLLAALAAQLPGPEWPAPAVGGRESVREATEAIGNGVTAAVNAAAAIGDIAGRRPRLACALLRAAPGVVAGLAGLLRLRRGDIDAAHNALFALQALACPAVGDEDEDAEGCGGEECIAVMRCPEVATEAFWVTRALGPAHCGTPRDHVDEPTSTLVLALEVLTHCIALQGASCPVSPAAAAAVAAPLLPGQPMVGAAAMALVLSTPVPAPMMAAAERFLPAALDMPGHYLRQGWRLTDPNAPTAIGVFSTPSVALGFLPECGLDLNAPSTVDALISRVPDLPRAVSAALQVVAAAAGLLPHPLGPLATAAARGTDAYLERLGDLTVRLRAALLLLMRLLRGSTFLSLAAALDTCDAAWPAAQAAAARHPDEAVRKVGRCVLCHIVFHTARSAAVKTLLWAAARLGIEGAREVQASFRRLAAKPNSTILEQVSLGDLIPVMERLADAVARGGAADKERPAGVCEGWGEPYWGALGKWAAARRQRQELERAGVEGGGASSSGSSSSRGRNGGGGELAGSGGDGDQAASGGGGLQAATESGGGDGCTVQQPVSGDGPQQPASGRGDRQQCSRAGKACAVCGATAAPGGGVLKKCCGCLAVLYCSVACQTQDWQRAGGHRTTCKQLRVQQAAALAAGADA